VGGQQTQSTFNEKWTGQLQGIFERGWGVVQTRGNKRSRVTHYTGYVEKRKRSSIKRVPFQKISGLRDEGEQRGLKRDGVPHNIQNLEHKKCEHAVKTERMLEGKEVHLLGDVRE